MDNRPIGIFDSGVGGLTVVKEVMNSLPEENIIYFGDTARVPYGSKTKETVLKFSRQIVNFLLSQDVKAIIIACNTVSSNCYETLAAEYDIPLIGVVESGAESCIKTTKNNIIGVIGTESTISSGAYEKKITGINPVIKVYSKACPLFTPLVEEGWTDNTVARITAEIYLQELIDKEIDTLLLGCTHYPILLNCIKRVVGSIEVINPASYVADKTKSFLKEKQMFKETGLLTNHTFYVSDNTSKFNKTCRTVLDKDYHAFIVDIGE